MKFDSDLEVPGRFFWVPSPLLNVSLLVQARFIANAAVHIGFTVKEKRLAKYHTDHWAIPGSKVSWTTMQGFVVKNHYCALRRASLNKIVVTAPPVIKS